MKFPILFLAFIVLATTLYAQNPRITSGNPRMETYAFKKGGDSIRFTILGTNDTLERTTFYRNGKIEQRLWKKDSVYDFNALGVLTHIEYDLDKDNESKDNLVDFYPNGQIFQLQSLKNKVRLHKYFTKDGRLLYAAQAIYAPNYTAYRSIGRTGLPIRSYRVDTLTINNKQQIRFHDTLYFDNGKPYKIELSGDDNVSFGTQYFKDDGSLDKILPPDSLKLIVFKDNVDCYYGLKNKRGDTIVKPRFDRIIDFNEDLWQAYTGEEFMVLQANGAPSSLPFGRLSDLTRVYPTETVDKTDVTYGLNIFLEQALIPSKMPQYYKFAEGNNYGVMTEKGKMIVPPQPLPLSSRSVLNNQFFMFQRMKKDSTWETGYINHQGQRLFSDKYKSVVFAYYNDYFFLCSQPHFISYYHGSEENYVYNRSIQAGYSEKDRFTQKFGLGKADGTVLLEPKFDRIKHLSGTTFLVSVRKQEKNGSETSMIHGLIDTRTKRWLLDTTIFRVTNAEERDLSYLIIENTETHKFGVMDTTGAYVLPVNYDSIGVSAGSQLIFTLKKADKYQIGVFENGKMDLHKSKYDFLSLVRWNMGNFLTSEDAYYVLAKRQNKWGVLDISEKVIKPFDYDYASYESSNSGGFLLVKNNQAACFNEASLPNETAGFPNFNDYNRQSSHVAAFSLADNSKQLFFINESGKVVIPPQFKRFGWRSDNGYRFVEDAQKRKKVVFLSTGQVIDFPFNYDIQWAHPKSRVLIVKDSTEVSFGVVSTDGKLLIPCNNYGVAIGDEDGSVFFVKRDTPQVLRLRNLWNGFQLENVSQDSLNVEDANWLMYNADGKLLSDKPFRFPVLFQKGIGVGAKESVFNLYKTDGSIMPVGGVQDFRNIQFKRERDGGFYTLFFNQGMTPTTILTKMNGEVVVPSGRYDGISQFYYQYALVSQSGKIGLMDTLGREVITPQYLPDFAATFIDSLDTDKKVMRDRVKNKYVIYYPSKKEPVYYDNENKEGHPDSLNLTTVQKTTLWNLMLQKTYAGVVQTASDFMIPRVYQKYTAKFLEFKTNNYRETYAKPKRIVVADNTMSFVLENTNFSFMNTTQFYNFYRRNNLWKELRLYDLLMVQGEKRWLLNDLITQKVKALKDQQIDCSNAAAFITTVENRWMLTKEGIDFCFKSTNYGRALVIVSVTWAELQLFLKMKI
jgi:hypothetical protein